MHVLVIPSEHFVPPEAPLAGIFQYDQAQALVSSGARVGVIAPELRSLRGLRNVRDWFRRGSSTSVEDGVRVFRWHGWHWALPSVRFGHSPVWLRAGRKLFSEYMEREGKPDVVHAHNARYAGMLGQWIKQNHGIPLVLTEHSSAYSRGLVPGYELPRIRDAFARADVRFVVSSALGADVREVVGTSVTPYEVLPNVLDPMFERLALPQGPRREGRFRFVSVAQLNANKGHADLLAACAILTGEVDFELHIVGEGPLDSTLRDLARSLALADRVKFVGRLGRQIVLQELMDADALIVSSHRETFGVVLVEALACGKPVISTRCGGPEDIVTAENGLLVAPSAPKELADAMRRMVGCAHEFDAARLRSDCLARYGRAALVTRLMATYESLVHQKSPAGSTS